MARITETVQETRTRIKKIRCDLCGRETARGDWSAEGANMNDTVVECVVGHAWPHDGGSEATHYDVDICPECFIHKLIPWLESQGAVVRKEEVTT